MSVKNVWRNWSVYSPAQVDSSEALQYFSLCECVLNCMCLSVKLTEKWKEMVSEKAARVMDVSVSLE